MFMVIKKTYITSLQMLEIDRLAKEEYGIPGIVLMENAGRSVSCEALRMVKGGGYGTRNIICVCGKGNNGGDGFVCARYLLNRGLPVKIFMTADADLLTPDARLMFEILGKMGASIYSLKPAGHFAILRKSLQKASIVIDAIFGIGLSGEVRDFEKSVIHLINRHRRPVLAVDVPSGLDATSGEISGACIQAERTVTFALWKTGFLKAEARRYAGRIIIGDISIPQSLLSRYAREG